MPKNTFEGAVMHYSDISTYYPINANYPAFDHFVFQQVLANPNDADNTYTLCAYAVFTVASGQAPVFITLGAPLKDGKPYKAPAGVQYANMKLSQSGLGQLYPPGNGGADMVITAVGPYDGGTNYVAYSAVTPYMIHAGTGVPLNPSPPFNG